MRYDALADQYRAWLNEHGGTLRGAGWREGMEIKYRIAAEVIREFPARVLDYGCGAGLQLDYFRAAGLDVRYTGVDFLPEAVELARGRNPDAGFLCGDALRDELCLPAVDYVLLNGVLTYKGAVARAEWRDHAGRLLDRLWPLAGRGLAFNVQSPDVDWERDDLFHVAFDEMAALATRYTRNFVVRHDYGWFESFVYLYRMPAGAAQPAA